LAAPIPPTFSAPPLPPPPPGNSVNGVPIPPAEAPVAPAAGEVPPVPQGPPPGPVAVPPPDGGALPAAPSAFSGNSSGGPSVAIASYDPRSGRYLAPDGQLQQVSTPVAGSHLKSWKDLLPI
jgi:phospholipid/cholesterol/gamma-HCH transport system substrate-binding protein